MEHYKFWYCDLKELGFKREKINDIVFFKQHGLPSRLVTKKLTNTIIIDFDTITRECTLYETDIDEAKIKTKIKLKSLAQLKNIIAYFAKEKQSIHEIVESLGE